ncbi:MAG: helix-turn-helix domain-containing protein [Bacillota bacterium]
MSDIYEALAAPARRALLDELQDRNGQTLFELCTRLTMKHGLNLSRQAISQHLEVLEAVGLVTSERKGRCKFHYLNTSPLRSILDRWPLSDGEEPKNED